MGSFSSLSCLKYWMGDCLHSVYIQYVYTCVIIGLQSFCDKMYSHSATYTRGLVYCVLLQYQHKEKKDTMGHCGGAGWIDRSDPDRKPGVEGTPILTTKCRATKSLHLVQHISVWTQLNTGTENVSPLIWTLHSSHKKDVTKHLPYNVIIICHYITFQQCDVFYNLT